MSESKSNPFKISINDDLEAILQSNPDGLTFPKLLIKYQNMTGASLKTQLEELYPEIKIPDTYSNRISATFDRDSLLTKKLTTEFKDVLNYQETDKKWYPALVPSRNFLIKKDRIRHLEGNIQAYKTAYNFKNQILQKSQRELQVWQNATKEVLTRREQKIVDMDEELSEMDLKIENYKKSIYSHQSEIARLYDQLDAYAKALDRRDRKIRNLECQLEDTSASLRDLKRNMF